MILKFAAMRGNIGKRNYFVAMIKLNLVPKLFKFRDWAELPPEQRAQRIIQKSRIPQITQYILDNEDGYLFSSLTASFNCDPNFRAFENHDDMGILEMPFEADLVINDGQQNSHAWGCSTWALRGPERARSSDPSGSVCGIGIVTKKVVPRPTSLVTWISP